MIFNLRNKEEIESLREKLNELFKKGSKVNVSTSLGSNYDLEDIFHACEKSGLSASRIENLIDNLPEKRTDQQNKALHVLFENIAFELNEIGETYKIISIGGIEKEVPYTANIIKNYIWRELQIILLDKESTTQLNTFELQSIFDCVDKWLSNKEIFIDFPSAESLNKKLKK